MGLPGLTIMQIEIGAFILKKTPIISMNLEHKLVCAQVRYIKAVPYQCIIINYVHMHTYKY